VKFTSRPFLIEAWQVGSDMEKPHWIDVELAQGKLQCCLNETYWHILDNEHSVTGLTASPGDWIIRGTEGELYCCNDSVFKKKYRPIV